LDVLASGQRNEHRLHSTTESWCFVKWQRIKEKREEKGVLQTKWGNKLQDNYLTSRYAHINLTTSVFHYLVHNLCLFLWINALTWMVF